MPVCALALLEKANKCALGTKRSASCEWKAAADTHRVQNPFSEIHAQQALTLLPLLPLYSFVISVPQVAFTALISGLASISALCLVKLCCRRNDRFLFASELAVERTKSASNRIHIQQFEISTQSTVTLPCSPLAEDSEHGYSATQPKLFGEIKRRDITTSRGFQNPLASA